MTTNRSTRKRSVIETQSIWRSPVSTWITKFLEIARARWKTLTRIEKHRSTLRMLHQRSFHESWNLKNRKVLSFSIGNSASKKIGRDWVSMKSSWKPCHQRRFRPTLISDWNSTWIEKRSIEEKQPVSTRFFISKDDVESNWKIKIDRRRKT